MYFHCSSLGSAGSPQLEILRLLRNVTVLDRPKAMQGRVELLNEMAGGVPQMVMPDHVARRKACVRRGDPRKGKVTVRATTHYEASSRRLSAKRHFIR